MKKKNWIRKGALMLLILLAAVGVVSCAGKEEMEPIIYDKDGMERLTDDFPEWARITYVAGDTQQWTARLDSDRLTLSYNGEEIASHNAYAVMVPEDPDERIGAVVMEKLTFDWPDGERGSCTLVSLKVERKHMTMLLLFENGDIETLEFSDAGDVEYKPLPEGVTIKAVKLT